MFLKEALKVKNLNRVLCLLVVLVAAAAAPALASDDPPPEPEWREHATERPLFDPGFSVCDLGSKERELLGGAVGGIIGGILGAQMGEGDGQLAATAVGTLLGAALGVHLLGDGGAMGRYCTAETLDRAPDGQTVTWRNPISNAYYAVTPIRTTAANGRACRDYTTTVILDGRTEQTHGTACRRPDGSWVSGS